MPLIQLSFVADKVIICNWYSGKKNDWPLHTAAETFLNRISCGSRC